MRIPEDAIPAAAFVFERELGRELSEFETSEIARHGLDGISPDLLARELCSLIQMESKGDCRDRQQSYWALGKRHDRALLPFFREQLGLELQRDLFAVYQILIALDNLSEPCFSADRQEQYSADDYDLNRRDAEAYLNSLRPEKQ